MTRNSTDYRDFEVSSDHNRRKLRQEELILEVTEALCEEIERQQVTRAELARRLGKSKAFVSQILAGGRNLTLRTLADAADALGCQLKVRMDRALVASANRHEIEWRSVGSFGRFRIVRPQQSAEAADSQLEEVA